MRIAHHIPGRIRLIHPAWKCSKNLAEAKRRAETIDGVTAVMGRSVTGSLILRYDAAMPQAACQKHAFWLTLLKPPLIARSRNKPRRRSTNQQRYRYVLQASLLSSLLTCAVSGFLDREGIHRIAGSLFLLAATGHLHRNRKQFFLGKLLDRAR